jgi:translation initiation factor IF-2
MAKIKIQSLTDKMKDEEILSKLKSIGVKIKDKDHEKEDKTSETTEKATASGETIVEKRVASTVIRRRVQAPPPPPPPVVEEKPHVEAKPEMAKEAAVKTEQKREAKKKEPEEPVVELVKKPAKKGEATVAQEKKIEHVGEAMQPGMPVHAEEKEVVDVTEETVKADVDGIGEEKKQEITRALEEVYKDDLNKQFVLVEDQETEEERKKKKAERLLKKIEEEEAEEAKRTGKGVFKRKVVIKEEDLYAARRRGKTLPFRKDRRDRREEHYEEEKKQEGKAAKKVVRVSDHVQVGELAKRLSLKASDVIAKLLSLGIMSNVNQSIDFDTAYLVAGEFGYEVEKIQSVEEEFMIRDGEQKESAEDLKPRSPVVTIMGHVDHGKTLLLDTIRNTNVAEREAGGITQHIGAYKAKVDKKEITFVDTPGHEAFTAMRARGALVTDIVILVVAADDGVMPQTKEAIDHAKAANVPIIVAINKIDKANANPDKVMRELSELGLQPEEWGGSTLCAKISAKKKEGIKELLELILLQAELLELKANPDKLAKGIIIESGLDRGHGPFGTVIIQEGTLKIQDPFLAGTAFGRVRALIDDKGKRIQKAPPAMPVMVVGFSEVPHASDIFMATTEESYAREVSKFRQEKVKEQELAKSSRITLDELYSRMGETAKLTLNVILKGDARGTLDAISDSLKKLSTDAVEIQILHHGVGAITETDVNLAMASGAVIIGFNVKPMGKAQSLAEQEKIDIRTYSVIYEMIDDVRKAMEGLLSPKIVEVKTGTAEIRKVFTVSKIGTIAGAYLIDGKVTRSATAKLFRKGEFLFGGKIASLKRFKDDVKEVSAGYEFGISLEGFNDLQEGDTIEFYVESEEKQTL